MHLLAHKNFLKVNFLIKKFNKKNYVDLLGKIAKHENGVKFTLFSPESHEKIKISSKEKRLFIPGSMRNLQRKGLF